MGAYACTESPVSLEQQFSVSSPSKAPSLEMPPGARLASALVAAGGAPKNEGAFRVPGMKLCCAASDLPSAAVVAVSQPGKPPVLPQGNFDAFTGTYVDSATQERASLMQDANVVTLASSRWGVVVGRVFGDTISVTLSVAPPDGRTQRTSMTLQGHVTDGQIRWSDGTVWDLEVVKEGTMLLLPAVEDDRNNPDGGEDLGPLPEDAEPSCDFKGKVDDMLNELNDLAPRVPPTGSAVAAEPTPQSQPKDSNGEIPRVDEPHVVVVTAGSHTRTTPHAASPTKVPPPQPFEHCESIL